MPYPELNLARRPFCDYRLFAVLLGVLYAAALGVTFLSVRGIVRKLSVNETTQARIHELDRGIAEAKAETETLRRTLSTVDFKGVQATAASVNDLIGRRSFAWSRILERLEAVLPDDVRLVSLSTGSEAGGTGIRVRLTCVTSSREGMLATVSALDGDPAFSNILPGSFTDEEQSRTLGKKFDLSASYQGEAP